MTAITITDLNNAKLDVDHIAAIATSTAPTATDRLGGIKKTMAGASADVASKVALVDAAKNTAINNSIPAAVALVDSAVAATAAGQATAAKVAAEAARDAAQLSSGIYATTTAGLAATTASKYFSVPSTDSAEYLILYLNSAGTAVEQSRYPSVKAINAAIGEATQSTNVAKGWAEGPVPTGGTRSSKGWAEAAQTNAATADTARAAVQLAISQVPSDTTLMLEATALSVLRGVSAATPVGRLAYLSEPGREGVWQLRAGDYTEQIASDVYGIRYVKVTAVSASLRVWERIIVGNVFHFSWTGLNADTPDARPYLQAGLDLFDANSDWVLPNHKMLFPSGNGSLTLTKPGVTLTGQGRATHLDYLGSAGQFLGLGLFLVSANDVTIENMHFSLFAPGNSASNPACIGVSYTEAFLNLSTGTLPKLTGTKIRNVSWERTSLGIVVGAYGRTDRTTGIGKPENTVIEDVTGVTNGVCISLFGAGKTDVRHYDFRWDSTLPLASQSAKQAGFRILGASDIRIGDGVITDFYVGFAVEPDASRIKNRRVHIYGKVNCKNVGSPLLIAECLEEFRADGGIIAKRSLTGTSTTAVVTILSNQPLSAVDPNLPAEEKVSITQDVVIQYVEAEGYAAFLSQAGAIGKLTVEHNKCVGNSSVSNTFGERYAVICRDPFGLPTVVRVNNNDFRMSSSASTASLTLGASAGVIEARRNLLPERFDVENSITVQTGSAFYADDIEQRPFNSVVNLGTNRIHRLGALANWRDGTPIPSAALPAVAAWARDLTSATVAESPAGTFTKTGAVAAYDGRVSSVEAMTGDFELVYRLKNIVAVDQAVAVGIDAVATNVAYGQIDWAVMYGPGGASFGSARPYKDSTALSIAKSYSTSTIERWRRQGSRLIFSRNNVDLFDTSVSSAIAFKLQISFARQNDAVEILRFGAI